VVAMIEACLEHSSTEAMPGTTPGRPCPERDSTEHGPGEAQQTLSGAALNRANWHPNDHRAPLSTVYT